MGLTKTDIFSAKQNEIAEIAKAMGHPARIAILDFLLQQNNCIGKELVEELPLAQATVSQHLKELKRVGLIKGTVVGNKINYCINKSGFDALKEYFDSMSNFCGPKCC